MQANTYEMDRANHTDETKWLLHAYVADKPHQPKYSQVSNTLEIDHAASACLEKIMQHRHALERAWCIDRIQCSATIYLYDFDDELFAWSLMAKIVNY